MNQQKAIIIWSTIEAILILALALLFAFDKMGTTVFIVLICGLAALSFGVVMTIKKKLKE